jgi:molybdopterin converting factor small subunit
MDITVYFFGPLVDLTAKTVETFIGFSDTESLNTEIINRYPALATKKYFMAVNQKMIQSNCVLINGDVVALMPPFSGG